MFLGPGSVLVLWFRVWTLPWWSMLDLLYIFGAHESEKNLPLPSSWSTFAQFPTMSTYYQRLRNYSIFCTIRLDPVLRARFQLRDMIYWYIIFPKSHITCFRTLTLFLADMGPGLITQCQNAAQMTVIYLIRIAQ